MVEVAAQQAHAAGGANQSGVAVKAVMQIADKWALKDRDLSVLLGGVSIPTIQRWRHRLRQHQPIRSELNRDQLDRVSYILGIYKALHILFPDADQADGWIHRPVDMPGFEGRAAIEIMRQGSMMDLCHVRRFLDGWRG